MHFNSTISERMKTASLRRNWIRLSVEMVSDAKTRKDMSALADQAVVSATNFFTGVIIGRTCAKEQLGLYMLGFTIVLFVTGIQQALISTPYVVYSPRLEGLAHARYTGSTLLHQLGLSGIIMMLLALIGGSLSFGIGPEGLPAVCRSLSISIAFIMFRQYIRYVCFAGMRMLTALSLDVCTSILDELDKIQDADEEAEVKTEEKIKQKKSRTGSLLNATDDYL